MPGPLLAPNLYSQGVVLFDAAGNPLLSPTEVTLLSSAVRATTTRSTTQTNYHARGIILILNVTGNPGGVETLSVGIELRDPVATGTYTLYANWNAAISNANGAKILVCYPGASATGAGSQVNVSNIQPLPSVWRAVVTHSSTGNWTYSLGGMLLP